MGKPPNKAVLEKLKSGVLEQVAFSRNTIAFHFSNMIRITLESSYSYGSSPLLDSAVRVQVPVEQSNLMKLLGNTIESVLVGKAGSLILNFANRESLALLVDDPRYESYHLTIDDVEYHV